MSCCSNSCRHTSVKLLVTFTFQCTMRAQECSACTGACVSEVVELEDVKTFIMNGHRTPCMTTTHSQQTERKNLDQQYGRFIQALTLLLLSAAVDCCYTVGDIGEGWYPRRASSCCDTRLRTSHQTSGLPIDQTSILQTIGYGQSFRNAFIRNSDHHRLPIRCDY